MPEIGAALSRALKRGDAPFLAFYCDHPSGAVRFWSRTGVRSFAGFEWTGCGILGAISGATRSTDLTINEVTFQLRGVPPTVAEMLSGSVRNRVAQVTRGAISRKGVVTLDDDPMIDALLDYQKLSIDPDNGNAVITLIGQQGFVTLDRAQDIAFSDQQQRSDFSGDCGFALVHTYVNKESNWRAS